MNSMQMKHLPLSSKPQETGRVKGNRTFYNNHDRKSTVNIFKHVTSANVAQVHAINTEKHCCKFALKTVEIVSMQTPISLCQKSETA